MKFFWKAFLVWFVFLFSLFYSAVGFEDKFFVGAHVVNPSISPKTLIAGNTLTVSGVLKNTSGFVVDNAYFVVQIEGDLNKDNPNVFFEETKGSYFLNPGEEKEFSFDLKVPENLPSGKYVLTLYLKNDRQFMMGIPFIYLGGLPLDFNVENKLGFSNVEIVRAQTYSCGILSEANFEFGCYPGPVGVQFKSGSKQELVLTIVNNGLNPVPVTSFVSLYFYDDTVEENKVYSLKQELGSVAPGKIIEKKIGFNVPEKPGAYSMKIVLKDSFGKTLSIYRHRIISQGESAYILNVLPDMAGAVKGEKIDLNILILPPADSNTRLGNASLVIDVRDNLGNIVFTKTEPYFNEPAAPFIQKSFSFVSEQDLKSFKVTARIERNKRVFDAYTKKFKYDSYTPQINSFSTKLEYSVENNALKNFVLVEAKDKFGSSITTQTSFFTALKNSEKKLSFLELKNDKIDVSNLPSGKYELKAVSGGSEKTSEIMINDSSEQEMQIGLNSGKQKKDSLQNLPKSVEPVKIEDLKVPEKEEIISEEREDNNLAEFALLFFGIIFLIAFFVWFKGKGKQ